MEYDDTWESYPGSEAWLLACPCRHRTSGRRSASTFQYVRDFVKVITDKPRVQLPVTITVLRPSGEHWGPHTFAAGALLGELKALVKASWGVPLPQQSFVHDQSVLCARDATPLCEAVLAAIGGGSESIDGKVVILTLVRAIGREVREDLQERFLMATARGDHSMMTELLTEGAWPHGFQEETPKGFVYRAGEPRPLSVAHAANDRVAVEILCNAGAEELQLCPPGRRSIGEAFAHADFEGVVRLLAAKADPDVRLRAGQGIKDTGSGTPLHACCAMHAKPGAAALAELLCRLGADLRAEDGEGDSPLAHARYFCARNVFLVLKDHGARMAGPYYAPRRL